MAAGMAGRVISQHAVHSRPRVVSYVLRYISINNIVGDHWVE